MVHDTYEDLKDLKKKQREKGIEQLTYYDERHQFKLLIPTWFEVIESNNPYLFSGTLPKVSGITNAIAIKSFSKSGKSFEEFEHYIVKHMVFGKVTKWSAQHTSMGKKELDEYKNLGSSYKVYLRMDNLIYHCQYVLTETETAYIWIDYTATQETFDKNKSKFKEFMQGFRIVKQKK